MHKPLVSVVIPTYNRETYLRQAIESVAGQSYSQIEIIVIDDGSDYNYAEVICDSFPNCYYYYKPNGGLSSARNFGIKNAKGTLIAFLDDDDFWAKDKLTIQVTALIDHPQVDLVHSAATVVDEKGNITDDIIGASEEKAHLRSGNVFWNALGVWVVKSPTPLIRKNVFKEDMMFDENIKVGEDIDFYQRLFYRHKILYIREPLAYYRTYDDEKRLSTQIEKYLGMELKMLSNFKQMGVKNPFKLHRIAIRLLKQAVKNWNNVYKLNKIKLSKFNLYIRPIYCMNNYFKK
jgi:glycosyltransferase involved in cell wall biosynthesis